MARSSPGLRALATPAVQALAPYQPGKPIDELERELGIHNIVKLASNENPFGASPRAVEAAREALDTVGSYPDGSGHVLKQKLANLHGVGIDQITLGNGSNDALVLLAEAFLAPGLEAVYSQYAFAVYPIAVQATGATCRQVAALPVGQQMAYGHDLVAMRAAIGPLTRLVFIANPNNPTGTYIEPPELLAFVRSVPSTALVVLDEAYFEYARSVPLQNGIEWLAACSNLVVVRTFAKAYGLAGLRIGYAVSHPEVADILNRIRQPFNVSSVALAAAAAALDDPAHVERAVAVAVSERARVAEVLRQRGLEVVPSAGNFLLVRIGPAAAEVYRRLLHTGIIVRPVGNYGLAEHLRLTMGRVEENERLLAALPAALEAAIA
ncbi:MAG TPA: histidinol-phosphate transaminase [Steroidobacteraceae bacterium]|nr:histidinol-phosphate transaminase [Steroidobacteraceae bacterium]